MMNRCRITIVLISIYVMCFDLDLFGQIRPEILPEDFLSEEAHINCYCEPGVRNKSRSKGLTISYGFLGESTYKEESSTLSFPLTTYNKLEYLEFDLKFPLINKENFKLLFGYNYFTENFDFQEIGNDFSETFQELNNNNLKKNALSLIISKSLNETRYVVFRAQYSSNGDYESLVSVKERYAIYKALGLYGFKPNEDFEWGIGLSYSKSFRNVNIIPFILFNRNFNSHWGIESVFPSFINLRYNFDDKLILLSGVEFASKSYRIDTDIITNESFAYAYNHSELLSSLSAECHISSWLWARVKAGYQINFSSDFESKNINTPSFDVDPTNSFFFNIGIFLSPPDSE